MRVSFASVSMPAAGAATASTTETTTARWQRTSLQCLVKAAVHGKEDGHYDKRYAEDGRPPANTSIVARKPLESDNYYYEDADRDRSNHNGEKTSW